MRDETRKPTLFGGYAYWHYGNTITKRVAAHTELPKGVLTCEEIKAQGTLPEDFARMIQQIHDAKATLEQDIGYKSRCQEKGVDPDEYLNSIITI